MPTEDENKFANKPSIEESQKEAQDRYSEIIRASQTRLAENIKFGKEVGEALGTLGNHLNEIGKQNEREWDQISDAFEVKLKGLLEAQPSNFTRLKVILEQTVDIQAKITKHKRKGETHYQSIYESILSDIIKPREEVLSKLVELEAVKGMFSEVVPLASAGQGVTEPLNANTSNAENVVQDVEEKPLLSRTGQPLNNGAYINSIRKLKWSDERIPEWIAEYMLQQNLIKEGQLTQVQSFLSTRRCSIKILWYAKANVLTTIFYELIRNSLLEVSKTFIAEKIEREFVSSNDSLKPLIAKASIMADLKPINITRRVSKDAYNYPDIISYLQTKLLEL